MTFVSPRTATSQPAVAIVQVCPLLERWEHKCFTGPASLGFRTKSNLFRKDCLLLHVWELGRKGPPSPLRVCQDVRRVSLISPLPMSESGDNHRLSTRLRHSIPHVSPIDSKRYTDIASIARVHTCLMHRVAAIPSPIPHLIGATRICPRLATGGD
jgi:hypothetical protein